ncbi:hypothetical protein Hanom_Chr14g01263521 [Helianthus anomalus]
MKERVLTIGIFMRYFYVETDPGILIPEVLGCLQYNISLKTLSVNLDDGIMGESRTCMGQERIRPGNCCLYKWLGLQLKAQQYMLTNNNIERENLFFAGSGISTCEKGSSPWANFII